MQTLKVREGKHMFHETARRWAGAAGLLVATTALARPSAASAASRETSP